MARLDNKIIRTTATIIIDTTKSNDLTHKFVEEYTIKDESHSTKLEKKFIAIGLNPARSSSTTLDKSNMKILNLISCELKDFSSCCGYYLYNLSSLVDKDSDKITISDVTDENIDRIVNAINSNLEVPILLFYGRSTGADIVRNKKTLQKLIEDNKQRVYISVSTKEHKNPDESNKFIHISLASAVRLINGNQDEIDTGLLPPK